LKVERKAGRLRLVSSSQDTPAGRSKPRPYKVYRWTALGRRLSFGAVSFWEEEGYTPYVF